MEDKIESKVQKLVALVIRGSGGERENAERFLRELCKKHEIEYDDLFNISQEAVMYWTRVSDDKERKVFRQVLARYGGIRETWRNKRDEIATGYKTTPTMQLEIMGIWAVLRRQYRVERKRINNAMVQGFIQKHGLYRKKEDEDEDGDSRKPTEKELREYWDGVKMASDMGDVEIRKQLKK